MMLASAVIHAAIGLWLKKSDDKLAFRAVLALSTALLVLPFAFIIPLPAAQAWPFLIGGAVIHFVYQLSQISAFERGDMGLVYPVMRGMAPALAAGFAFLILKETLSPIELSGLLIAAFALIAFGWPSRGRPERWGSAMIFAIICGIMIAFYSVIDGAGMRIAREGQGQIWSYLVWFFLLDWVFLVPVAIYMRRNQLSTAVKGAMRSGAIAGIASLFSYGLALIAFSLAPIGPMSAMRETSVVFGAVFAAVILKEPFGQRRIILAVILSAGLIAMQFG